MYKKSLKPQSIGMSAKKYIFRENKCTQKDKQTLTNTPVLLTHHTHKQYCVYIHPWPSQVVNLDIEK